MINSKLYTIKVKKQIVDDANEKNTTNEPDKIEAHSDQSDSNLSKKVIDKNSIKVSAQFKSLLQEEKGKESTVNQDLDTTDTQNQPLSNI